MGQKRGSSKRGDTIERCGSTGSEQSDKKREREANAGREAKGGEGRPKGQREHLAERRGAAGWIGRRGGEEERSEKTNGGVKKWKDISPGAVRGRVGDGSRIK